ncbi:protein kinase domain-containing protein [Tautonia rosea]|uniref:protein kinase domain-containing protein n=1 Tax=Tautonia rosea TaxID=2728037 RepID=UPI001475C310|nr:serine/threonine-protein kinase [Tautonia rosea]
MTTPNPTEPSLSPTAALRIDGLCDRFEADWTAGRRPRIEDLILLLEPIDRRPALGELLRLELALRRNGGEVPDPEEYFLRFPGNPGEVDAAFSLDRQDRATLIKDAADSPSSPVPTARDSLPPGSPAAPPSAPAGYEILGILGRGGMGVVYRAHQVRLKRDVALKMILAGGHASSEAIARFLAEAEAIARLRHPNVVQIYELGDHEGWPYFAMEYLARGSLARELDGAPRSSREAVALIEQICRGVAEAHRLGIVHRDLKPANILIADDGAPKVADFGLAKTLGTDSGLTRTDLVVGTPSYMSPEQASGSPGGVGPEADVHALGAILYELLTGRPPFRGASALETVMQVRTIDPVPPRRLVPGVSRDAETIALTCLQKDPARRYASAEALADDLARYLEGRPIVARPVGPVRRVWLWCRRRPAQASLAGLLALAVSAGSASAIALWLRAESNLAESNRRLDLALDAVEQYHTGVGEEVLLDQPELEGLRRRLLQTPMRFYRQLGRELQDGRRDPRTRARLVETLVSLANLIYKVGTPDDAIKAYREAIAVARPLAKEHPNEPSYLRALGDALIRLAEVEADTGRLDEARTTLDEALRHHYLLARLEPGDPAPLNGQAACLHYLGNVAWDSGEFEDSEEFYRQGIALREQLARDHRGDPEFLDNLAGTRNNLAILLANLGRTEEAEVLFRASLDDRIRLVRNQPDSDEYRRKLSSNYNNLGSLRSNMGRSSQALPQFEAALKIQEDLVRERPNVALYQFDLATSHVNLAVLESDLGNDDRAVVLFRQAIDRFDRLVLDHPGRLDYALLSHQAQLLLGESLFRLVDYPAAEDVYQSAVALANRLGKAHPDLLEMSFRRAWSRASLAGLLAETGRTSEARAAYVEAIELFDSLSGGTDQGGPVPVDWAIERARCLLHLGLLELRVGRSEEAKAKLDTAIEAVDALFRSEPGGPDLQILKADATVALGLLQHRAGDPVQAAAHYEEAASSLEAVLQEVPGDSWGCEVLARALSGRARILADCGRPTDALAEFDRALGVAPAAIREELTLGRLEALCLIGDPFCAIAETEPLVALPQVQARPQLRIAAAVVFSRAASALGNDALADRAEAELLAIENLAALGDGLAALELLQEPALDPILGRPALLQLHASLSARLGDPSVP